MEAEESTASAILEITRPGYKARHMPVKPVIIMLSGLPGTGKSYLSHKLAELLGFTNVESDAVRKELFPKPSYSTKESATVFRSLHNLLKERLENGLSVIFDATNLEERYREIVYKIAGRSGAKLILVEVEAPPELVRKRLESRTQHREKNDHSDATWVVYRRMKKTAEKISRPHYTVNTERDITPIINKIVLEANR
jgi:predicted kinase